MTETLVHDIGDRRKLTCEVRDEADALTDADELVFIMREPDGVLTTYELGDNELVRESEGLYYVYWDCAKSGKHYWRWAASGNVGAAEEASFKVAPSKVLVSGS